MGAEGLGRGPGGWGGALLPFVLSPSLIPAGAPRNEPALLGPAIMPRTVSHPTILVFDSGLGGLTVYREVAQRAAGRRPRLCGRRRRVPLRTAR